MAKLTNKTLSITTFAFVATLAFPTQLLAADEHNVVPGLTAVGKPLGLHGVDPVALIHTGNKTSGNAAFTEVFNNVAYYFTSEKNKKAFTNNPSKYVPQNGGFCTFGVSVGKKFDGNPNYSSVVDGKLYVFLNEDIYKLYLKDKKGTIEKAKQQWQKIEHEAATSL